MTEVPDYLLERSRDRRAALGLGGDAGDAPVPAATAGDTAPATAASAAVPAAATPAGPAVAAPAEPPPPPPPYVEAAIRRKRIPGWAIPVLALLPFWAVIYAGTLSEADTGEPGPLEHGGEIYAERCASCHGATGGGGVGPALSGGAVLETFANPADQLLWVALGSDRWPDSTYGDAAIPVEGGMPSFQDALTPEELNDVVRYEREVLSGEDPAAIEGGVVDADGGLLIADEPAALHYFGEGAEAGVYEIDPEGQPVIVGSEITGASAE